MNHFCILGAHYWGATYVVLILLFTASCARHSLGQNIGSRCWVLPLFLLFLLENYTRRLVSPQAWVCLFLTPLWVYLRQRNRAFHAILTFVFLCSLLWLAFTWKLSSSHKTLFNLLMGFSDRIFPSYILGSVQTLRTIGLGWNTPCSVWIHPACWT
jgi:hypothetical protein